MSGLALKDEEGKEKDQNRVHSIILIIVSIIYGGFFLIYGLFLWLAYTVSGDNFYFSQLLPAFIFPGAWTIGSIFISKVLISKNRVRTAYITLFSVPLILWLYMILIGW